MPRTKPDPALQPVININTSNPTSAAVADPPPEKLPEEKEPRKFMDHLQTIPMPEWGRVWSLELHRLEPKLPGVPGSKGYLCMFLEPIGYPAIQQRYGGGKFRLNLCKNGRWSTSHDFDIEGQPIYDRNREVPPAANGAGAVAPGADFQREFISVLREELQRSRESSQATVPGSDHVVEMLTKASDRAMEIVTKQAPQPQDPTAQVTALLAAAEKLAALRAPVGGGLTDKLLEAALPLLLNALKPKTLAEQLAEAKAMKELLSGTATDAEPADWRAMAVKMVTEHLPEILDALKTQPAAAPGQPPARNVGLRTETTHLARQTPPHAQPSAPAAEPAPRVVGGLNLESRNTPAANPAPGVEPPAAAPMPETQEQYDEGMKVQIVNMFRYGAGGTAIAMFLEDIKPEMAKDIAKYPAAAVTEFFSKDGVLRLMTSDPRWPGVLQEAQEYLLEEEEENAIPVN